MLPFYNAQQVICKVLDEMRMQNKLVVRHLPMYTRLFGNFRGCSSPVLEGIHCRHVFGK